MRQKGSPSRLRPLLWGWFLQPDADGAGLHLGRHVGHLVVAERLEQHDGELRRAGVNGRMATSAFDSGVRHQVGAGGRDSGDISNPLLLLRRSGGEGFTVGGDGRNEPHT